MIASVLACYVVSPRLVIGSLGYFGINGFNQSRGSHAVVPVLEPRHFIGNLQNLLLAEAKQINFTNAGSKHHTKLNLGPFAGVHIPFWASTEFCIF
jgi:hypothetical protein